MKGLEEPLSSRCWGWLVRPELYGRLAVAKVVLAVSVVSLDLQTGTVFSDCFLMVGRGWFPTHC